MEERVCSKFSPLQGNLTRSCDQLHVHSLVKGMRWTQDLLACLIAFLIDAGKGTRKIIFKSRAFLMNRVDMFR